MISTQEKIKLLAFQGVLEAETKEEFTHWYSVGTSGLKRDGGAVWWYIMQEEHSEEIKNMRGSKKNENAIYFLFDDFLEKTETFTRAEVLEKLKISDNYFHKLIKNARHTGWDIECDRRKNLYINNGRF